MKQRHQRRDVSHLDYIDVYRVLQLYDVTDPCLQHAITMLLCAGLRGAETEDEDIQEAIDTLIRKQHMQAEDDQITKEVA